MVTIGTIGKNVKWIDATIWTDESFSNEKDIHALADIFDRYAFGREHAGTTGTPHFQFRGVLKRALTQVNLDLMTAAGFRHITPTHVKDFAYVLKESDYFLSWEPMPDYLKEFEHDRPLWTHDLDRCLRTNDGRSITLVYDAVGGAGKTTYALMKHFRHQALYIPCVDRAMDIASAVIQSDAEFPAYIVDLPRGFDTKDKSFWAGLENLRNGVACDPRNKYKVKYLSNRPNVVVMCNILPKNLFHLYSADRLKVLVITKDEYGEPIGVYLNKIGDIAELINKEGE